MKCSKCGNDLKVSDKFCTKCGTSVEIAENGSMNRYAVQKNYNVMWGMVTIASIISFATWIFGGGFGVGISMIGAIFVVFFILVSIGAFANILFKCPNCNEEITLYSNTLYAINDTESTCNCPKCNKKLIFNNKEQSVKVNNEIEKVQSNSNSTSNTGKLEELYNLKTKGIISEEEFEKKKQEMLSKI